MNRRHVVEVLGIFSMFACTLLFFGIWMLAYLNGGRVLVSIDRFGEMYVELALWVAVAAMCSVALHSYIRGGRRG